MTTHNRHSVESSVLCEEDIAAIQQRLLSWFTANKRDLPWRTSYIPYHVWIAEIMGQQTQMDRVVDYFLRWMNKFPDIADVARASEQQILKCWEGLGYYSRAKNIRKAARVIMDCHDGVIPDEYSTLLALPGIGPYTAAAILSIAFNKNTPLLDANVERLFVRLLDIDHPVKRSPVQKILQQTAHALLPTGHARQFNQALMEFGALVCKPRQPQCRNCTLKKFCRALQVNTVDKRPVRAQRQQMIEVVMACGIIFYKGKYYIQQRLPDDVWGSLWEFPGGRVKTGEPPIQAVRREIDEKTELAVQDVQPFAVVVHQYTKYRVTLHGYTCTLDQEIYEPVLHSASQFRWVELAELTDFAFPAGHRQLVERLF